MLPLVQCPGLICNLDLDWLTSDQTMCGMHLDWRTNQVNVFKFSLQTTAKALIFYRPCEGTPQQWFRVVSACRNLHESRHRCVHRSHASPGTGASCWQCCSTTSGVFSTLHGIFLRVAVCSTTFTGVFLPGNSFIAVYWGKNNYRHALKNSRL
jgi:hypothetical protein